MSSVVRMSCVSFSSGTPPSCILPVRSFGDAVKHPMHGLMGSVVIGPPGSQVCADNRFGLTLHGLWLFGLYEARRFRQRRQAAGAAGTDPEKE